MSAHEEPANRALMEGRALLEIGRPADAAAALSRAVAADPQSPLAHASLALAELKLSHYPEARDAARRALALDAETEWAHRIVAVALMRLGDRHQAREEALRAVAIAPDSYLGYIVLAEALLGDGDLAGALKAANHAVQLAPDVSDAHSTVALVKLRHEDWSAAESAARRALRLDPENPIALNNLAVALRRQRRKAESAQAYEQAARIAPANRTIRRNILRLRHTTAARHLSEPTRTLIADDTRARRYRPQRWDWARAKRIRPWWWVMLSRIPAPRALGINLALFGAFLVPALASASSGTWGWAVIFGLGLPFSGRRAWRWWRIRHPPAGSWTPLGTDERKRSRSDADRAGVGGYVDGVSP